MADEPVGVDTGPDTGGAMYDDPNREVVGVEPAWVEGDGGGPVDPKSKKQTKETTKDAKEG